MFDRNQTDKDNQLRFFTNFVQNMDAFGTTSSV